MCPACLATAALIAAGSTSAGGVAALVGGAAARLLKRRRADRETGGPDRAPPKPAPEPIDPISSDSKEPIR